MRRWIAIAVLATSVITSVIIAISLIATNDGAEVSKFEGYSTPCGYVEPVAAESRLLDDVLNDFESSGTPRSVERIDIDTEPLLTIAAKVELTVRAPGTTPEVEPTCA